jgi:hypothetical protein
VHLFLGHWLLSLLLSVYGAGNVPCTLRFMHGDCGYKSCHQENNKGIHRLDKVKAVPEVCTIHAATANPLEIEVAETEQGRSVMGITDGSRIKVSKLMRTSESDESSCAKSSGNSGTNSAIKKNPCNGGITT